MLRPSRHPAIRATLCVCASGLLVVSTAASAVESAPVSGVSTVPVAEPVHVIVPPRGEVPLGTRVQVWVDLAMPAVAMVVMPSARAAYWQAVNANQETMIGSLRAHGAVELARLRLVCNSIAIELPSDAVDAVRQMPGVLRVRPVTHLHRIHPPPPVQ